MSRSVPVSNCSGLETLPRQQVTIREKPTVPLFCCPHPLCKNLPGSRAARFGEKVFLSEPGQDRSSGLPNPARKHGNSCPALVAFHSHVLVTPSILNSAPASSLWQKFRNQQRTYLHICSGLEIHWSTSQPKTKWKRILAGSWETDQNGVDLISLLKSLASFPVAATAWWWQVHEKQIVWLPPAPIKGTSCLWLASHCIQL